MNELLTIETITHDGIFSMPLRVKEETNIEYRNKVRDKIMTVERFIETLEQIEGETLHTIVNNTYARQLFIPKGTLMTGKIHKTENIVIISMGDVSVLTESGVERHTVSFMPITFSAPIGVKRVIYAHEDTFWTNLHQIEDLDYNQESNFKKMESSLFAENYEELNALEALESIEA